MQTLGKAILLIVGAALIGIGMTAFWQSAMLFQQNVQSLEKLQKILQK